MPGGRVANRRIWGREGIVRGIAELGDCNPHLAQEKADRDWVLRREKAPEVTE